MNIPPGDWPRLLQLLDQALDIPEPERDAWLHGLVLSEHLRSALSALLVERRAIETNDFLGALPVVPEWAASSQPKADTLVGHWRLLREIGRGGMSSVWLAERADDQVERRVALKLPHVGPGQEVLAARLLRERNILAALEHRNIARLYDVGVSDTGTPYLVMEYVEGTDLLTYANSRCLTVLQRLAVFQQVLRAVQYAHSKLILHRDIKPSNILVNEPGDVKLLDFGIAKLLAADDTVPDNTELTRAAGRQLTLAYASPEQIRGESLGTASDVYSLGVVLYELLTGERPYVVVRDSRAALEEAILNIEPRRPSLAWSAGRSASTHGATAKSVRRLLAGDLDVIAMTALQKAPTLRYPTVEAMALDLQRHMAGEPIFAQASSPWVQLRKFVVRHAVAVSAGLLVVAALAVGLGTALWQGQKAREEATRATAIKTFLVNLLRGNDLDRDNGQAKGQVTLRSVLERSATDLATDLKGQPEVRDELQGLVADLLDNLDLLEASIPLRKQYVQDLAMRHAPIPVQVRALRQLAESQNSQLGEARASLERAWSMCQADPPSASTSDCLVARLELGRNLLSSGDIQGGQVHVEAAAPALLTAPVLSHDRALAARTLGELRTLQERPEEADSLARRALSDFEALWGASSTRLAVELRLFANQLALQRRFAEAIAVYGRAWKIRVQAAGPTAISSAKLELDMGQLMFRVGQVQEGALHVQHASEVMLLSQGPERAQLVFNARRVRAELYIYDGQLGLAGPALDQLDEATLAYQLNASEAYDRDLLRAYYLTRIGEFSAALRLLEHRREVIVQQQGPSSEDALRLDRRRIDTLISAGKPEAAAALARESGSAAPDEVLLALGQFSDAWPGVQTRYARMKSRPRSDQYVAEVVKANELMGIALVGRGQPREGLEYFEQAISALTLGYANNPVLASLRARKAMALTALRDTDAAHRELTMAEAALKAEPLAGPQFKRVVQRAKRELEKTPKKV